MYIGSFAVACGINVNVIMLSIKRNAVYSGPKYLARVTQFKVQALHTIRIRILVANILVLRVYHTKSQK